MARHVPAAPVGSTRRHGASRYVPRGSTPGAATRGEARDRAAPDSRDRLGLRARVHDARRALPAERPSPSGAPILRRCQPLLRRGKPAAAEHPQRQRLLMRLCAASPSRPTILAPSSALCNDPAKSWGLEPSFVIRSGHVQVIRSGLVE